MNGDAALIWSQSVWKSKAPETAPLTLFIATAPVNEEKLGISLNGFEYKRLTSLA